MAKFSEKWRLIKKVLRSEYSFIVTFNEEGKPEFDSVDVFGMQPDDANYVLHLLSAVKKYTYGWYGAWLTNHKEDK